MENYPKVSLLPLPMWNNVGTHAFRYNFKGEAMGNNFCDFLFASLEDVGLPE